MARLLLLLLLCLELADRAATFQLPSTAFRLPAHRSMRAPAPLALQQPPGSVFRHPAHTVRATAPVASSAGHSKRASAMLPARCAVFSVLFGVLYPPLLAAAVARAVYQRAAKGAPPDILPLGAINPLGPGCGYSGQMLFDQPLDAVRLESAFRSLASDAGVEPAQAVVDFEEVPPRQVAPDGRGCTTFDFDGYTDGPAGPGTGWLESGGKTKDRTLWLRVFNAPAGETSVIQYHLPALYCRPGAPTPDLARPAPKAAPPTSCGRVGTARGTARPASTS